MGIIIDIKKKSSLNSAGEIVKTVLFSSKDQREDLKQGKTVLLRDHKQVSYLVMIKKECLNKIDWCNEDLEAKEIG